MYSDEISVHALLQKVLSYSHAEQTEVVYLGTESALTRFANNFIHQNVAESNHELRVFRLKTRSSTRYQSHNQLCLLLVSVNIPFYIARRREPEALALLCNWQRSVGWSQQELFQPKQARLPLRTRLAFLRTNHAPNP